MSKINDNNYDNYYLDKITGIVYTQCTTCGKLDAGEHCSTCRENKINDLLNGKES